MSTGGTVSTTATPFASVEEAIDEIRAGRMVVVCDSEDRENEGDLIIAAQFATPEAINFMATHARGLICLALTEERCEQLGLQLMVRRNESPQPDGVHGLDRGPRRASPPASRPPTARARSWSPIDPDAGPEDLVKPGHVFPLRAKPGGVLERAGHTEAAIDLARLAGLHPGRGDLRGLTRGRGRWRACRTWCRYAAAARAQDGHDRADHRAPPAHRAPRRAGADGAPAHPLRRVHGHRLPQHRRRQAPPRAGPRARSTAPRTCSCASTRSA